MTPDIPKPQVQQQTPEELAAAEQAKNSKLNAIQESAGMKTEQLFRLFGASSAFGGGSAPILSGLE